MKAIEIMILLLLLTLMGLGYEKFLHKEINSAEMLTQYFLNDLTAVISTILKFIFAILKNIILWVLRKQRKYHIFDDSLVARIINTCEGYSAKGFDVECYMNKDPDDRNPARFLCIKLMTKKRYSKDELQEVTNLLKEHFRAYLSANNLHWMNFATYLYCKGYLVIKIYFAEFPEEEAYVKHRYAICIREQSPQSCDLIRDEELDRELGELCGHED